MNWMLFKNWFEWLAESSFQVEDFALDFHLEKGILERLEKKVNLDADDFKIKRTSWKFIS